VSRNCSNAPNYNITQNFAYLVCGFSNQVCGFNPDPKLVNHPELDKRFTNNSNFILARGDPITISTAEGFGTNKRCTYVIKKSKFFINVKISITDNFNTVVTYFKGNDTFSSLTGRAEVRQTALSNQMWEISVADTEYVYLQLTSRQEGAFVKFTVQGQGD
jgi:hypothetical protein